MVVEATMLPIVFFGGERNLVHVIDGNSRK
jgi:hypothetical protein